MVMLIESSSDPVTQMYWPLISESKPKIVSWLMKAVIMLETALPIPTEEKENAEITGVIKQIDIALVRLY